MKMKAPPLKKVETCKYCLDYKGDPKPIQPEDMKHARRMEDGSYMCKMCQIERMLKLNGIIKNGNENTKERKR